MSKDNKASFAAPASGALSDPLLDLLCVKASRLVEVAGAGSPHTKPLPSRKSGSQPRQLRCSWLFELRNWVD